TPISARRVVSDRRTWSILPFAFLTSWFLLQGWQVTLFRVGAGLLSSTARIRRPQFAAPVTSAINLSVACFLAIGWSLDCCLGARAHLGRRMQQNFLRRAVFVEFHEYPKVFQIVSRALLRLLHRAEMFPHELFSQLFASCLPAFLGPPPPPSAPPPGSSPARPQGSLLPAEPQSPCP